MRCSSSLCARRGMGLHTGCSRASPCVRCPPMIAWLMLLPFLQVIGKEGSLVDLADSPLAGNVRIFTDYDPEWEVDVASLQMLEQIGGWRWRWSWRWARAWVRPAGTCTQAHDGGVDLPCSPREGPQAPGAACLQQLSAFS